MQHGNEVVGKREWSGKIPFGPYLALGALIWMFFGADRLGWYVGLLAPCISVSPGVS